MSKIDLWCSLKRIVCWEFNTKRPYSHARRAKITRYLLMQIDMQNGALYPREIWVSQCGILCAKSTQLICIASTCSSCVRKKPTNLNCKCCYLLCEHWTWRYKKPWLGINRERWELRLRARGGARRRRQSAVLYLSWRLLPPSTPQKPYDFVAIKSTCKCLAQICIERDKICPRVFTI
jgi:hypothetical protein